MVLAPTFAQAGPGEHQGFHYSRAGNPTRARLERALAELEGAAHCYAFASGCAAATSVLLCLRQGDHVVMCDDVYAGTYRVVDAILKPLGIGSTVVDLCEPDALARALKPETRMLWIETPTNPLLKIIDIEAIASVAKARSIALVVDSTFATPLLQRPLELGATLVVHSTTKYLNGHSDVVGGAVITDDGTWAERLALMQRGTGAVPSAFDCYMTLRGLSTLAVRMQRQVENARVLADWLVGQPQVERVHYPGLPTHPQAELAARQMTQPGAIVSLELRGGYEGCVQFLKSLRLFACAISLGAVESLAEHPASMSHRHLSAAVQRARALPSNLVRMSIGIEDVDDLREDIEQALAAAACRS
jgi:cystathionine beta-lyase/cystathionine gamma-synthase